MVPAIIEFFIRGKILKERAGRKGLTLYLKRPVRPFQIAEVDLAESIALFVLDMPRHIDSEEHGGAGVDRVDALAAQVVTLTSRKHHRLRPDGTGLPARCGPGEPIRNGDEIGRASCRERV